MEFSISLMRENRSPDEDADRTSSRKFVDFTSLEMAASRRRWRLTWALGTTMAMITSTGRASRGLKIHRLGGPGDNHRRPGDSGARGVGDAHASADAGAHDVLPLLHAIVDRAFIRRGPALGEGLGHKAKDFLLVPDGSVQINLLWRHIISNFHDLPNPGSVLSLIMDHTIN